MAEILNDDNFQAQVLDYKDGPVLVDFFAVWCGPCQQQMPIIDELAKEAKANAKVFKVDVDQSPKLAEKYGIMSVPTLILFKNGEIAEQMPGMQSKEELEKKLQA